MTVHKKTRNQRRRAPLKAQATKAASTRARVRIIKPQPLWQQYQRIGGGVTPVQVSSILQEADNGNTQRLIDLGNESRQKDLHLQSVCSTRDNSVALLDYKLIEPEDATDAEKANTEHLRKAIAAATGNADPTNELRGFGDLVAHSTGAYYPGFSVAETRLTKDADGLVVPSGWYIHSARRFGFRSDGTLVHCDGSPPENGLDFLRKKPGRFVVNQPRITGDVPAREGLLRVLVWAALFRNWGLRDWLSLAEIGWKPWRLGKYKSKADGKDIEDLVSVLEQMSSSGVAVTPDTTEIEIAWPKGNQSAGPQSTHAELFSAMATEMSKGVLGQTLTTEAGSRGARSLGEVHDRVRKDVREGDALGVASSIQRHLIRPLTLWNYGADVRPPVGIFVTDDAVDLLSFAEAIAKLVEMGLEIPANWVRDKAGAPEPQKGEAVLKGPVATEPPDDDEGSGSGGGGGNAEDDEAGDDPEDDDTE